MRLGVGIDQGDDGDFGVIVRKDDFERGIGLGKGAFDSLADEPLLVESSDGMTPLPATGAPLVTRGGQPWAHGPEQVDCEDVSASNRYSVLPSGPTRNVPIITGATQGGLTRFFAERVGGGVYACFWRTRDFGTRRIPPLAVAPPAATAPERLRPLA